MELLIKRDRNHLVKTEGKAELDNDVPNELKETRVVPQSFVKVFENRESQDDLLISNEEDYMETRKHLKGNNISQDILPGIWSGYRSTLIKTLDNKLFRLKGVSLNPNNPQIQDLGDNDYQVFGGQPKFSARFEKQMSDKFNKALAKEGIIPVMKCKGYWNYPNEIKGNKYSASVVQVEGDTRLDEMMLILEQYFVSKLNQKPNKNKGIYVKMNNKGEEVSKKISYLYKDIGFITGRLKKLMDKHYQTWSADGDRSNAHIGNIVLYNGSEDVKVGFVDFDASCDTRDFSRSKIKKMQKQEFETICRSAQSSPISLRQIQARYLKETKGIFSEYRESFIEGFNSGYNQRIGILSPAITNTIPFGRFLEIFEVLRSDEKLSPELKRVFSGLKDKVECGFGNFDAYDILDRNKKYQKDLLNNLYTKDDYLFNSFKDHNLYGNRGKSLEKYFL
jgi:hypothetical protein